MKLSPPWTKFYKELEALFKDDPGINMAFEKPEDESGYKIKLYVEGANKAEALSLLLPTEKAFGNVTVKIDVIPANFDMENKLELFKAAFEGNPALCYTAEGIGVLKDKFNYVVFKPEIVQFFNDDMGDVHGYCTTLYQEIAKDVFEDHDGIYFCTGAV